MARSVPRYAETVLSAWQAQGLPSSVGKDVAGALARLYGFVLPLSDSSTYALSFLAQRAARGPRGPVTPVR